MCMSNFGGRGALLSNLLLVGEELIFTVREFLQEFGANLWVMCFFIKPIGNLLNPFYSLW